MAHRHDVYVTVYGRVTVLDALRDPSCDVAKVVLAANARGPNVDAILATAAARGVPVRRASPQRVKLLAGNGRHDGGAVADLVAPRTRRLEEWLADLAPDAPARVLVLDGVTNPANVGMILRSATAAGLEGVALPRAGAPDVDPLVMKASAGVALRAPVLRCATSREALGLLRRSRFAAVGLSQDAPRTLFEAALPARTAYVLGSETAGVSADCAELVDAWISIPLRNGVESLNVACAASVLAYESVRRGH